jgi:hypothetical protein
MFAVVVVLLNALSFASLAYVANRKDSTPGCPAGGGSMAIWRDRRADLVLALMSRRFAQAGESSRGLVTGPSRSYGLCNSCALNSS